MNPPEGPVARATDRLVTAFAYAAGLVLVGLMLLTTADVAGRYFFNAPLSGVYDFTHFAVLTMVFLGLSYSAWQGAHVVIELLYDYLPARAKTALRRLINVAGAAMFGVIAWQLTIESFDVRAFGEASNITMIPFFPFYWLAALGSAAFAWVMLYRAVVPEPRRDGETA